MAKTPANPEALKAKQTALELVRVERAKVEKQAPALGAAVKTASARLEAAKLNVFVARGTPGYEDDAAAEASVAAAQSALDEVCRQRDAADDRLEFLIRADGQLTREVEEIRGALHLAHVEQSKAELRERIATKAPMLAALIAEIAAMRALNVQTSWPQEVHQALEDALRKPEDRDPRPNRLALAIGEGQGMADRIRAGATVEEVCP